MELERARALQRHAGILRRVALEWDALAVLLLYQAAEEAGGSTVEARVQTMGARAAYALRVLRRTLGQAEADLVLAVGEVGVPEHEAGGASSAGGGG